MRRAALATLMGLGAMATTVVAAPATSIIFDGSLGHTGALLPTAPGIYQITPSMGKTFGPNIFQSFGAFNLGTGDTADFEANLGTQNIVARVTGGSLTTIDGTITSTVGGPSGPLSSATIFFVNPAGVLFTANARLSVNGPFLATTANYVKLSDGTTFWADTVHPISDAGLTSAPISAFGFTSPTPAPIGFSGSQLTNAGGIHVIGGDITLDHGTTLLAPAGNLTLFSAGGAGEVPFSVAAPGANFGGATNTAFGNITIQNGSKAAIDSAQGGGSIVIRGGRMVVDNSQISSANSGPAAGGNISVQADQLAIQSGAQIIAATSGAGKAGDVSVTATSLTVDSLNAPPPDSTALNDEGLTGIFSLSEGSATGNSGSVNIHTAGALALLNGGAISSATFAQGNAGTVTVQAGSMAIDGFEFTTDPNLYDTSGVFSNAVAGSTGSAGDINVTVTNGDLDIDSGGDITSSTNDPNSNGNAGNIVVTVNAGNLNFTNGGEISSSTLSGADAGSVTVMVPAGSLSVDGYYPVSPGYDYDSGIYSNADPGSTGKGGNVAVTVGGTISITNGGVIDSATYSYGDGGSVTVQAGALTIDGADSSVFDSGIYSNAYGSDYDANGNVIDTGSAGAVNVTVNGALRITNGAEIISNTNDMGNAGNVTVKTGSLFIAGSDPNAFGSGIYSDAGYGSSGNAGSVGVTVDKGNLDISSGGEISTSTFAEGIAGSVTVAVTAGSLSIDGFDADLDNPDSGIYSNAVYGSTGYAGSIGVTVNGKLNITDGAEISSSTFGDGGAGTVMVKANSLTIDGSDPDGYGAGIYTNAYSGDNNAGNIGVTVKGAIGITDFGRISSAAYATGNGGSITITANSVELSGAGAQINAVSTLSDAGNITINAMDLSMLDQTTIKTSAANNGGSIVLNIAHLLYMEGSVIQSAADGPSTTSGGNITIDPQIIVLDYALISANDLNGSGGKISIVAGDFLNQATPITATGGVSDGAISISAPDLDLSGGLLPLPVVLENDEKRLRDSCARSINREYSSLTVVGRGGTETSPDELQPDFGDRYDFVPATR